MNKAKPVQPVSIRILIAAPPPGVRFAVQRGRSELLEPSAEQYGAIQFDFSVRAAAPSAEESTDFAGEFVQGPPSDRFIYINSGTLAGEPDSCWTRRAKLKLASIPWEVVAAALSHSGGIIEARVVGTMGDGGPICASVKPHAVVWSFVRDAI